MDDEEKIKKLKEEIKTLCVEVYGKSGDEIIKLIEKANSFFTSGLLMFTDERDTISLCHFFKKCIIRDKKKLREKEVEK